MFCQYTAWRQEQIIPLGGGHLPIDFINSTSFHYVCLVESKVFFFSDTEDGGVDS